MYNFCADPNTCSNTDIGAYICSFPRANCNCDSTSRKDEPGAVTEFLHPPDHDRDKG